MQTETVFDIEIEAYIDGELDLEPRLAVEDYLSRHPELAAKVMLDLRNRSALQLLAKTELEPSEKLNNAINNAGKMHRAFGYRRALSIAAMLALTLTSVFMLGRSDPPPTYVGLAAASHRTLTDRVSLADAEPLSDHNHVLLMASRIAVPRLPDDWRVTDVELLDAEIGPAMLIAVQTNEGKYLSILAIRQRSSAPKVPDAVRNGKQSVAYWRRGDFSYALTGEGEPEQIDARADALADLWKI